MEVEQQFQLLLSKVEAKSSPKQLQDALQLLEKLAGNIVSNPGNEKFRTIKTTNATIKSKLIDLEGMQDVLVAIGFVQDGQTYVMLDQMLPQLLENIQSIREKRMLVAAQNSSPEQYKKAQAVVQHQRALKAQQRKDEKEKKRLTGQLDADKLERLKMEIKESRAKQIKFGTKATTYKDIGVDLCKKGG